MVRLLRGQRRPPTMHIICCLSVCDVTLSLVYLIDAGTDTVLQIDDDGCGASAAYAGGDCLGARRGGGAALPNWRQIEGFDRSRTRTLWAIV